MEITVQQVELLSDDDYIYLDVRGEIAYQHGHIPKAYEWAGDFSHIEELPKDKRLIVYCNYGEKSAPIAEQLRQEGYEALNLSGGYREWLLHVTSQKEQMQDVSKDGLHLFSSTEELTPDEVKRYDRQIILPQVGSDGQKKLKKSKVLIIGAGGLGAPAALYLAGAGVGTIGIVDADDVSVSIRTVRPGEKIILDASSSFDPDKNSLSYQWWQYREAGSVQTKVAIKHADEKRAEIIVPDNPGKQLHLILELTDDGIPNLKSYKRIILNINPLEEK